MKILINKRDDLKRIDEDCKSFEIFTEKAHYDLVEKFGELTITRRDDLSANIILRPGCPNVIHLID